MSTYQVNEIFRSIQGEGYWTGMPCTFIRLQGCNLRCEFCDTPDAQEPSGPLSFTLGQLVTEVIRQHRRRDLIILTGGEPTLQDIKPLTQELQKYGPPVHLETNGSIHWSPKFWSIFNWITLSPKKHVRIPKYLARGAHEIKWLVQTEEDVRDLQEFLNRSDRIGHVCLQPVSQNPVATKIAYQACLDHGWRLSLQMHKYLEVR